MGAAAEALKNLVDSKDCYDIPQKDLLPKQIEAANELLQERVGDIKFLANRVEETGVREIRNVADLVPLLFAHTSYKTYPEAWFSEGKWDRMSRWVDTLTTHRVPKIDTHDIQDVDGWVERMAEVGHYLSCSSGTTGKCSIVPLAQKDREFLGRQITRALSWSTGISMTPQFKGFTLSPLTLNVRNVDSMQALTSTFMTEHTAFSGDPITVGQVNRMVGLRRSITDGTAKAGDIAAFEALSKSREEGLEQAIQKTAESIIAARGDKLFVQGLLATVWLVTQRVREMGYSGKDFGPDNALTATGGNKGAVMPPDARELIFETFNIRPRYAYQFYSMQEINTTMPRCAAGRYHVAPWVMLLVLDETGDALIDPGEGEIEGRAAFFDMSLDGRWAGLITGDKITADFGRCACGHEGPTIGDKIVRYSELAGGDKITCSGTVDAYVRGVG